MALCGAPLAMPLPCPSPFAMACTRSSRRTHLHMRSAAWCTVSSNVRMPEHASSVSWLATMHMKHACVITIRYSMVYVRSRSVLFLCVGSGWQWRPVVTVKLLHGAIYMVPPPGFKTHTFVLKHTHTFDGSQLDQRQSSKQRCASAQRGVNTSVLPARFRGGGIPCELELWHWQLLTA